MNQQKRWELTFFVGEAPDYAIPFRAILCEIVDALSEYAEATLQVQDYESGEDFIEGCLSFGSRILNVYFEYSLGYVALCSEDRALLDEVWVILSKTVAVGR